MVGKRSVTDAGPGAIVSWVLAGIGCVMSGLSYAELSSIIPTEGGAYAYAFVALGELPATITAWCLTLEVGRRMVIDARGRRSHYLCGAAEHVATRVGTTKLWT